ncbi:MAG TPA: N-acetylmuramoyl-L-alanine amidase, partial [Firmicutes bacterium]|nr:N-acetylmuramoyl-L-alanine amidase [Bacillota bacterium]
SIHANSFLAPEPNGTETFFYGVASESQRLAGCVHSTLVASLGLRDRNVKERELYLLREVRVPSCLVEVAFASNIEEEILMMSPNFRQKAASAIFEGLQKYFKAQ